MAIEVSPYEEAIHIMDAANLTGTCTGATRITVPVPALNCAWDICTTVAAGYVVAKPSPDPRVAKALEGFSPVPVCWDHAEEAVALNDQEVWPAEHHVVPITPCERYRAGLGCFCCLY